jgi:hypothetical protein
MAQHDYIIANQSGAAFRSDLNNGLAAIVSQNSGAAQPSTTYAYQWWADTTTGLLKLRNAANNAWITIGTLADANLGLLSLAGGTLTGALLLDDSGTVSAPALAFDGDTNTGIWRSAADTLNVATNGVENLELGTTEVVFNDGGADIDFRVEGDTKPNLFKVDAGTDKVVIDGLTYPSADGTADQSLVTNGSGVLSFASRSQLVRATAVATTSGTSIDFTSIPSWVRRITVVFTSVSTSGTSTVQIQIGDSGGVETTGYTGTVVSVVGSNSVNIASFTAGAQIIGALATSIRSGSMTITNIDGNQWQFGSIHTNDELGYLGFNSTIKTLSATLDRVRLTTGNGTDTFDAGSVNIIYEG